MQDRRNEIKNGKSFTSCRAVMLSITLGHMFSLANTHHSKYTVKIENASCLVKTVGIRAKSKARSDE